MNQVVVHHSSPETSPTLHMQQAFSSHETIMSFFFFYFCSNEHWTRGFTPSIFMLGIRKGTFFQPPAIFISLMTRDFRQYILEFALSFQFSRTMVDPSLYSLGKVSYTNHF